MSTILLTEHSGQVGRELRSALAPLGRVIAPEHAVMDLADPEAIRSVVRATHPSVIINVAAYTAVDKAEAEPTLAAQINTTAPEILAVEAKRCDALFIHYSTDYVFDGKKLRPMSRRTLRTR